MRNLKQDLEICNAASAGPWEWWDFFGITDENTTWCGNDNPPNELIRLTEDCKVITAAELEEMPNNEIMAETIICATNDDGEPLNDVGLFIRKEDAMFIAEAREGWPHAIQRALEAEKELALLKNGMNTK